MQFPLDTVDAQTRQKHCVDGAAWSWAHKWLHTGTYENQTKPSSNPLLNLPCVGCQEGRALQKTPLPDGHSLEW